MIFKKDLPKYRENIWLKARIISTGTSPTGHHSLNNFIANSPSAMAAYCFFEKEILIYNYYATFIMQPFPLVIIAFEG